MEKEDAVKKPKVNFIERKKNPFSELAAFLREVNGEGKVRPVP